MHVIESIRRLSQAYIEIYLIYRLFHYHGDGNY